MRNKKRVFIIIIYLLYQEMIFNIFGNNNFENIWLKMFFTLQIAMFIASIFVFDKKINKIIGGILILITGVLYSAYFVYYKTFGAALSLYSISQIGQVLQFGKSIINILISNWYVIILMFLPLVLYFIVIKKSFIGRNNKKEIVILISVSIICYLISLLIINLEKDEGIYSTKNLYYNINSGIENLNNFGVLTTFRLDVKRTIFPFEEKLLYEFEDINGNTKVLNIEEYNMLNIDFENLIQKEDDEMIEEIHKYIYSQEPSKKNEYTGIYEGKNLIVIVGESFSSLAIKEDLTPTLYELSNQGFMFNNFYTPLFPVSTADGQYLTDTGILPSEGTWSIENVEGKAYPYSYGNVFKNLGYNTYAYHNYNYDYYKRDEYFEVMGYDTYLAKGNGLEDRMDFFSFPSSDYEMVKSTITDYINDEKFVAYYLTMSGHIEYDKEHAIVQKNWEKVKDLPYSEKVKAYLATQIELDKAVKEIIDTLKANGKLEETVIVISGDHYPYGLNENEIKEISSYDISDYCFEKFHMPLIIYNSENIEKKEINKYACSLDILPTVLNLFGVKYDSRLLMGRDILSDSEAFVIFSDRSFITDKGKYNSRAEQFTSFNKKEKITKEYLDKMEKQIYYKYRYSRLILENNYYKYLKEYIE